jgi:RNA polymerase sigma-70 factor (ECF subfamily)
MELHVPEFDRGVPDESRLLADRDELERGFSRLTPEQRALIVLHYYVGLPMQETADTLNLPLGTVKSRLSRATQAMRASLDSDARAAGLLGERPL